MFGPAVDCNTDPIPAVRVGAPTPVVPACVNPALSNPDGPAPTFLLMQRHNVRLIKDGLTATLGIE